MRIKVEAIDTKTLFQLQDTAPKGVTVKLGGMVLENQTSNQPVAAVITYTPDVASSAIGTWLYEKIKSQPARVSINRVKVRLHQDEINQLLQEESTKELSGTNKMGT